MKKTIDLEKNREKYLQFVESRQNLILNLLDNEGKPFTSCAPFVKKDGKLYIYISEVAEHFHFMENSAYVDALIVADESATKINLQQNVHDGVAQLRISAMRDMMIFLLCLMKRTVQQ